jgi:hypothetical protein
LILWYIPNQTKQAPFGSVDAGSIDVFYFIQLWYLYVSAKQIKHGYVVFSTNTPIPFNTDALGHGLLSRYLFKIYLNLPFVFEMKSVWDWTNTTTSLDVFMWLQVEEIYAQLFTNKCNIQYRRDDNVVLTGKASQPLYIKVLNGALIYIVLMLFLVGPMLMFSGGAGFGLLTVNPTTGASLTINMIDGRGSFVQLYQARAGTQTQFLNDMPVSNAEESQNTEIQSETLRVVPSGVCDATSPEKQTVTQVAIFPNDSPLVWQISPPTQRLLTHQLRELQARTPGFYTPQVAMGRFSTHTILCCNAFVLPILLCL